MRLIVFILFILFFAPSYAGLFDDLAADRDVAGSIEDIRARYYQNKSAFSDPKIDMPAFGLALMKEEISPKVYLYHLFLSAESRFRPDAQEKLYMLLKYGFLNFIEKNEVEAAPILEKGLEQEQAWAFYAKGEALKTEAEPLNRYHFLAVNRGHKRAQDYLDKHQDKIGYDPQEAENLAAQMAKKIRKGPALKEHKAKVAAFVKKWKKMGYAKPFVDLFKALPEKKHGTTVLKHPSYAVFLTLAADLGYADQDVYLYALANKHCPQEKYYELVARRGSECKDSDRALLALGIAYCAGNVGDHTKVNAEINLGLLEDKDFDFISRKRGKKDHNKRDFYEKGYMYLIEHHERTCDSTIFRSVCMASVIAEKVFGDIQKAYAIICEKASHHLAVESLARRMYFYLYKADVLGLDLDDILPFFNHSLCKQDNSFHFYHGEYHRLKGRALSANPGVFDIVNVSYHLNESYTWYLRKIDEEAFGVRACYYGAMVLMKMREDAQGVEDAILKPDFILAKLQIALKYNYKPVHFLLAQFYEKEGENLKALEQYRHALNFKRTPAALALYGRMLMRLGYKDQALSYLYEAVSSGNFVGFIALIQYFNGEMLKKPSMKPEYQGKLDLYFNSMLANANPKSLVLDEFETGAFVVREDSHLLFDFVENSAAAQEEEKEVDVIQPPEDFEEEEKEKPEEDVEEAEDVFEEETSVEEDESSEEEAFHVKEEVIVIDYNPEAEEYVEVDFKAIHAAHQARKAAVEVVVSDVKEKSPYPQPLSRDGKALCARILKKDKGLGAADLEKFFGDNFFAGRAEMHRTKSGYTVITEKGNIGWHHNHGKHERFQGLGKIMFTRLHRLLEAFGLKALKKPQAHARG